MNLSTLNEQVFQVETDEDLSKFIEAVGEYFRDHPDEWENPTLERYLDAMSRWTHNIDSFFKNRGEPIPHQPTWKTFAMILIAATMYE